MIKHVGMMMVRNEGDVLAESLAHHGGYFDTIVVQDGSTDGGEAMLRENANVVRYFHDREVLRPGERWTDGHRNTALQWIVDNIGVAGVWVTLLHADEFWVDDPVLMAEWAHADGATHVLWGEYRFFLHSSERNRIDVSLPVAERIKWYCGPFYEARQFHVLEHQVYLAGKDHCTLPVGLPGQRWRHIPRYRHFPYRSNSQVRRCYEDKCRSRYWQPDHGWLFQRGLDPYVDGLPEPANSRLARWDRVGCLSDGRLPNPELLLPESWRRENPGV